MGRTSPSTTATDVDRGRESGPFLFTAMNASTRPYSFELFPPRTPEGSAKLPAIVGKLAAVKPAFFMAVTQLGSDRIEVNAPLGFTAPREE